MKRPAFFMLDKEYIEVPLDFPEKGLDDAFALSQVPVGFTTEGENVRWHEALTERGRGGSRSGVSKYIDEQVSGTNEIQGIFFLVSSDGNALGWHFEGEEFEATGLYQGLDLSTTPGPGDDEPTGGGGGYQPGASFQDNKPKLYLTVDDTEVGVGEVATITAHVTDADGNPLSGQTVVLHTSRGARPGDGARRDSEIDGEAEVEVTDDKEETVTYIATIEDIVGGVITRSRNTVKVTYGGRVFLVTFWANFLGSTGGEAILTASVFINGNIVGAFVLTSNNNFQGEFKQWITGGGVPGDVDDYPDPSYVNSGTGSVASNIFTAEGTNTLLLRFLISGAGAELPGAASAGGLVRVYTVSGGSGTQVGVAALGDNYNPGTYENSSTF